MKKLAFIITLALAATSCSKDLHIDTQDAPEQSLENRFTKIGSEKVDVTAVVYYAEIVTESNNSEFAIGDTLKTWTDSRDVKCGQHGGGYCVPVQNNNLDLVQQKVWSWASDECSGLYYDNVTKQTITEEEMNLIIFGAQAAN